MSHRTHTQREHTGRKESARCDASISSRGYNRALERPSCVSSQTRAKTNLVEFVTTNEAASALLCKRDHVEMTARHTEVTAHSENAFTLKGLDEYINKIVTKGKVNEKLKQYAKMVIHSKPLSEDQKTAFIVCWLMPLVEASAASSEAMRIKGIFHLLVFAFHVLGSVCHAVAIISTGNMHQIFSMFDNQDVAVASDPCAKDPAAKDLAAKLDAVKNATTWANVANATGIVCHTVAAGLYSVEKTIYAGKSSAVKGFDAYVARFETWGTTWLMHVTHVGKAPTEEEFAKMIETCAGGVLGFKYGDAIPTFSSGSSAPKSKRDSGSQEASKSSLVSGSV